MYFVTRVFFRKTTHEQQNSIQKYEEEIPARKRFYSILASDIDSDAYEYEMVQIVRSDGICIASQVFDNREPEPAPEVEGKSMASGNIPKIVHGLGTEDQTTYTSFPFTAPSDGVLYYRFTVSNSANPAWSYLQETSTNYYIAQALTSNGVAVAGHVVVKKGWVITNPTRQNCTLNSLMFIPFV